MVSKRFYVDIPIAVTEAPIAPGDIRGARTGTLRIEVLADSSQAAADTFANWLEDSGILGNVTVNLSRGV